ncbi:hypothetical protein H6P81_017006 [Aristolochia fimbriata]|uniref:Pectinesterase inhibitor domain-containing protein n=1 Tax=Aristolochia fimbriata TaxID=158543 RepID=A0AAV7E011_ARIFI|nr:hypothetical protein H6P81_017006 [Aristolochia fimbriata]
MAASFTHANVFFSFFFFLSIPAVFLMIFLPSYCTASFTVQNAELINKACSYTSYDDLCRSSLNARPESRTAGPTELMLLAFDIAVAYGRGNERDLGDLATKVPDPTVRRMMVYCRDLYKDSNEKALDAKGLAFVKSFQEALRQISRAITGVQQCGDGLRRLGRRSPFPVARNEKQLGLLNIANVLFTIYDEL